MRDFFLSSPWPGTIAWALIYTSDFVLTITCARLYHRSVSTKIGFEGSFELNPLFQRDVDSMKFVSLRFLLMLVLSSTMTTIYWALAVASSLELYAFLLGAAMSLELAIHVRHLENLFLFSSAEQLRGQIEYPRPLIFRMSSIQLLSFAMLFAIVFIFTGSWFVAGGVVSCFCLAVKHWFFARRTAANRTAKTEQAFAG